MNLIKFFAKRRYRKGFTLTELIVSIALIAIIMATVAAFSGPVQKLINNANAKADAITINKILGDYIEHRLAYAEYMDIYVGTPFVDVTASDPVYVKMIDSLKALSERMSRDGTDFKAKQRNNARMLVFRFEENTEEAMKSTFKVYDVPILNGMTFSNTSSINALLTSDNLVFRDEFFGGYEYFYTIDDPEPKNYLSLRFEAYNFKDYPDGMTAADVVSYREKVYNLYQKEKGTILSTEPTPKNEMDDYLFERTAYDDLTFRLQNLAAPTIYFGDSSVGTTTFSSDIYIFYNVRTYDIAGDRSEII